MLEYSLDNTDLPKTWSVAKDFLSSASDLCERWNLLFWRLGHDFARYSDTVLDFRKNIYSTRRGGKPGGASVYICFPPAVVEGFGGRKCGHVICGYYYIINYHCTHPHMGPPNSNDGWVGACAAQV